MPDKLTEDQIKQQMDRVPQWTRQGSAISRTYEFPGFMDAVKFVNGVAELAEQRDHHPDIDIRFNKVTLTLSTHSIGGLSENDFSLAEAADRL